MKIYSIFYKEDGVIYNLYEDKNGEWWINGSKLFCHLFYTLKEANKYVKQVRAENHLPNSYKKKFKGKIFVGKCEVNFTQ